jgi:flagellum-specific ATP synthase
MSHKPVLAWPTRELGLITASKGPAGIASFISLPPGSLCRMGSPSGPLGESISFQGSNTLIMALAAEYQWVPGTPIYSEPILPRPSAQSMLGRVVDGLGEPLDGLGPIPMAPTKAQAPAANPMERRRLSERLDVGVRSINGLLPIAQGQRIGIFAGSGVGKSTLLSMMAKHTKTEKVVLALIGERSREVREFIEDNLGAQGLARSVVIAVSAGESPLMKIRGAHLACDLADEFKQDGLSCLLIMDSLTRYAMACREIGLAFGETPASKGYPPSVFSRVNSLVERAGPGSEERNEGDITAFYTVLSEGDDLQDPVADNARAILDGHIVLSRQIADSGIYPPIDITASVSRTASMLAGPEQAYFMRAYRQLISIYSQNEDLIKAGAYQKGQDAILDQAIAKIDSLRAFCMQDKNQACTFEESMAHLKAILG